MSQKIKPSVSTAFFKNLFPESKFLRELYDCAGLAYGDLFGFLCFYGRDCAGALTFLPEDCEKEHSPNDHVDITNRLEEIFDASDGTPEIGLIKATGARVSIAGGQNKLPVLFQSGHFSIPGENSFAPTNAILKPQVCRFPDLHKNEHFCTELARTIGLPVVKSELVDIGKWQAYLTWRYDRVETTTQGLQRLHQEDFCQALEVNPEKKYQEDGGPTVKDCYHLVSSGYLADMDKYKEQLTKILVYNYITGNCDYHAKNFSLLHTKNKVELAPFYDLVSTFVYPELDRKMAMSYGKASRHERIKLSSWQDFAKENSIDWQSLTGIMADMCVALAASMENLASVHEKKYGKSDIYSGIIMLIEDSMKALEKFIDPTPAQKAAQAGA